MTAGNDAKSASAYEPKHPISHGQPTRETICWREHNPGYVCMLDEGHDRCLCGIPGARAVLHAQHCPMAASGDHA